MASMALPTLFIHKVTCTAPQLNAFDVKVFACGRSRVEKHPAVHFKQSHKTGKIFGKPQIGMVAEIPTFRDNRYSNCKGVRTALLKPLFANDIELLEECGVPKQNPVVITLSDSEDEAETAQPNYITLSSDESEGEEQGWRAGMLRGNTQRATIVITVFFQ